VEIARAFRAGCLGLQRLEQVISTYEAQAEFRSTRPLARVTRDSSKTAAEVFSSVSALLLRDPADTRAGLQQLLAVIGYTPADTAS
jgi:hypothetical protein